MGGNSSIGMDSLILDKSSSLGEVTFKLEKERLGKVGIDIQWEEEKFTKPWCCFVGKVIIECEITWHESRVTYGPWTVIICLEVFGQDIVTVVSCIKKKYCHGWMCCW